ncbi:MAG: hypothetical protein U9O24_07890, partial [Campylobacterota bacterium]|nr:hypothetical protein [Campylobacterota bacterium]
MKKNKWIIGLVTLITIGALMVFEKLVPVQSQLLEEKKGRYFAIKRFDRLGDNRIHIHSVSGLTHSDFRFPTVDYDDLLSLTLHLTKDVN